MFGEIKITYLNKGKNKFGDVIERKQKYYEISREIKTWMIINELKEMWNLTYTGAYMRIRILMMYGFIKRRRPVDNFKERFGFQKGYEYIRTD